MVAVTAAYLSVAAGAGAQEEDTPEATEIGVTADTITITVIADVDNAARPGLFKGSADGVQAAADYINEVEGGLAGRELEVNFIDSRLSGDEARSALIQACQDSFAVVGTTALFLNNIDPAVNCVDQAGAATGLPDVPVLQTETDHQCSPVSFPVIAGQLQCDSLEAGGPETYISRQGHVKYHLKQNDGELSGVWVIPGDLPSTIRATVPLIEGGIKAGIEEVDRFEASALGGQSEFTPVMQAVKSGSATYVLNGLDYRGTVQMRKEATIQGVTGVQVFDCTLQCYDQRFIEEGGADVEGQFVSTFFIPFEEAKQNNSVQQFLKFVGKDNADGFGAQAWAAGLFFRDVVNNIVEANGVNGLTRAAFLEEAANVHDFTAEVDGEGMLAPTDVGGHKLNSCFVMMQVKDGKFKRVFPKAKGEFSCNDKKNLVTVEVDQIQ
ncbi:MAG: ABC transporter substrate-binding protein [Actinobacteria bacterium]|nr:ABC transporter substrate-binding protein [Actinomycetota bacterium]